MDKYHNCTNIFKFIHVHFILLNQLCHIVMILCHIVIIVQACWIYLHKTFVHPVNKQIEIFIKVKNNILNFNSKSVYCIKDIVSWTKTIFNRWMLCLFFLFLCLVASIEESATETFMKRLMTNSIAKKKLVKRRNQLSKRGQVDFFWKWFLLYT